MGQRADQNRWREERFFRWGFMLIMGGAVLSGLSFLRLRLSTGLSPGGSPYVGWAIARARPLIWVSAAVLLYRPAKRLARVWRPAPVMAAWVLFCLYVACKLFHFGLSVIFLLGGNANRVASMATVGAWKWFYSLEALLPALVGALLAPLLVWMGRDGRFRRWHWALLVLIGAWWVYEGFSLTRYIMRPPIITVMPGSWDWKLFVCLWAPLALLPLTGAAALLVAIRAPIFFRSRWKPGICPRCGYDLRGQKRAGCPECGWGRAPASA